MDVLDRDDIEVLHRSSRYVVGKAKRQPKGEAGRLIQENELVGEFDGVRTFIDYLEAEMSEPRNGGSSAGSKENGFHEFNTYKEAMEVYTKNPRTIRKFDESDRALIGGDSSGIESINDVTGDYLDISRYLEGDPECFGIMHNGNPRGRRVNIYLNSDFSCYVNKEDINYRGQRIQRLIDWLEGQQVRVSLTAIFSAGCSHTEIRVKDHDEVLDMNDIAIVSHSDFFRRLHFRFTEYSDKWDYSYGNGRILAQYFDKPKSLIPDMSNELILKINNGDGKERIEREFNYVEGWLAKEILSDSMADKNLTMLGNKYLGVKNDNGENEILCDCGDPDCPL